MYTHIVMVLMSTHVLNKKLRIHVGSEPSLRHFLPRSGSVSLLLRPCSFFVVALVVLRVVSIELLGLWMGFAFEEVDLGGRCRCLHRLSGAGGGCGWAAVVFGDGVLVVP